MGGRGSSSGVGRYGGGGVSPNDIISTSDMLSNMSKSPQTVSEFLGVSRDVWNEYGENIGGAFVFAEMKPGTSAIAYYDGSNIGLNTRYANASRMNKAYDDCVSDGFHPKRGNKTGAEAVAAHEIGHALTDAAAKKMGVYSIDEAATRIVTQARKSTSHRGVVQMAAKISRYATHSNAEAVAEAFADVYCNGSKAAAESRAIVATLNGYIK